MAEEFRSDSKPKDNNTSEVLFWLILVALAFTLLKGLPDTLYDTFGLDIGYVVETTRSLDSTTPAGTVIVQTSKGTLYRNAGTTPLGTISSNAPGVIISGPVSMDGKKWWYVEYDDGTKGWMDEENISVDVKRDREIVKSDTPVGSKVVSKELVSLHESPGGPAIGSMPPKTNGTIVVGPVANDGVFWWKVRFDDKKEAWVRGDTLSIDLDRNARSVNADTAHGSRILATSRTDVWDEPLGVIVGAQSKNALGTISNGPVKLGTTRWWEIDFNEGEDGWVREKFIEQHLVVVSSVNKIRTIFVWLSYFISTLLILGIIYVAIHTVGVVRLEQEKFSYIPPDENEKADGKNPRWQKIIDYADSEDPNSWRLAIIEADILLEDMVTHMGYQGDNLGEKLLSIKQGDFRTLNQAWEAHKVRNRIAHEGSEFFLAKREVKRVIELYRQVFQEFHFTQSQF